MTLPARQVADPLAQLNFEALDGKLRWGTGSPEGAVAAPVGTLYLRTDGGVGTTLYVKESGSGDTGWDDK